MIMAAKVEYLRLKNFERKIKLPFMVYTDFKNILGYEGGKQNSDESY